MRILRMRSWLQNIYWKLYSYLIYFTQNNQNKVIILQAEFIFLMKKFYKLEEWLKNDIRYAKYLQPVLLFIFLVIAFWRNPIKIFGWGLHLENDSVIDLELNKMVKLFNNIFLQKLWINFMNKLKMAQKDFH